MIGSVLHAVVLTRACYHSFTFGEFSVFACNVKQSLTSQDKINLIRFVVAVDSLVLSGFQAI